MTGSLNLVIGIDGGGTSCRIAALCGPDRRRIEARGGPANVSDFDGAIRRLTEALDRLATDAGTTPAGMAGAVAHFGLAGVVDRKMAERVAAAFRFTRINVTDDQPTTIAGALGAVDGAVAAIGTGSFVGRQSGGAIRACGGWGFTLGDQASGAWLGRRILGEALLAHDGLRDMTPLLQAMLDRFGGATGITTFGVAAAPADFASLAPDILTAARSGDLSADQAFRDGAQYIEGALSALGWQPGEPLCLVGGLGPDYRDWLDGEVAASCMTPKGNALDGALALASRLAEERP